MVDFGIILDSCFGHFLKKFPVKHVKIITDSLGLIFVIEVFFSLSLLVTVPGALQLAYDKIH